MIKSTTKIISIDKINVPSNYARTIPVQKVAERLMCYKGTGTFDREIIVDEYYNLIDGYSTYLACKTLGLTKVRALRIIVNFTAQELCEMLREQIDREFARKVGVTMTSRCFSIVGGKAEDETGSNKVVNGGADHDNQ